MLVQSAELVQEWAMRINMVIRTETQRPTNLLVIINPFGGARKARKIWRKKAEPVFLLAGKPCHVFQCPSHALPHRNQRFVAAFCGMHSWPVCCDTTSDVYTLLMCKESRRRTELGPGL